jgi:hypothetical protein
MNIDYKRIIGWGFGIFAVIYLMMSALVAYGLENSLLAKLVGLTAVTLMAIWAGRSVKAVKILEMIKYSLGWTIIVFVLDLILTVPLTGWGVFSQWQILLSYLLLLVVPLFFTKKEINAPAN